MSKKRKDNPGHLEVKEKFFDLVNLIPQKPKAGLTYEDGHPLAGQPLDDCFIWTGAIQSSNGYGAIRFSFEGRNMGLLHQFMYVLAHGKQPPRRGQGDVQHRCNNKLCCNPDHIFASTHRENMEKANRDGLLVPHKLKNRPDIVEDILLASMNGVEIGVVAKKHGVSNTLVSHIRSRRIHKKIVNAFALKHGLPSTGPLFWRVAK